MTLTDDERYAYEERIAICTIEGVSEERAAEDRDGAGTAKATGATGLHGRNGADAGPGEDD